MITYDSSSILVYPSSKIDWFCQKIAAHISLQLTQSQPRYQITVSGYDLFDCICSHQVSNFALSVVWTQFWIRVHNSRNSLILKCVQIALSTCHQQYSTWQLGYVVHIAFTCAWLRSVIYIFGKVFGLCALINCKKYLIVTLVPLDDSIQAMGTPLVMVELPELLCPWAYLVGTHLQCTYILPYTTCVTWLCVPLVCLTPIPDISVILILSCFRFIDVSWLTFLFQPPFTWSCFPFDLPASLPILARMSHINSYYQDLFCSLLSTLPSISQPMLSLLMHCLGLLWLDLPMTWSFVYCIQWVKKLSQCLAVLQRLK